MLIESKEVKRTGEISSFIFSKMSAISGNELRGVKPFVYFWIGLGFRKKFVRWLSRIGQEQEITLAGG